MNLCNSYYIAVSIEQLHFVYVHLTLYHQIQHTCTGIHVLFHPSLNYALSVNAAFTNMIAASTCGAMPLIVSFAGPFPFTFVTKLM